MSRQGVRWRFHHLFDGYVRAFEAIVAVEKSFGTELREYAIRISRERYQLYQEALRTGFQNADQLPRFSDQAPPTKRENDDEENPP
jgi:hypothetical protein